LPWPGRRAAGRPGHRQRVVRDIGADDDGQDTRPLLRRRGIDRLDDVVVAGAPAKVALETKPDLALGGVGIALEQLLRRHDHPRRAEPALEAVLVPERLLQGMQRRSLCQALDGGDLRPVGLDGEDRAGLDAVPVDLDGARPAVARIAANMGPREPRQFADVLHQ